MQKASGARTDDVYIVVADELTISAGTRMSKGSADSADALLSAVSKNVFLTSVYGGVDYKTLNDAKMVFDIRDIRTTLMFSCDITIDDIVIEHKYDSSKLSALSADTAAMIAFTGHKAVIGENVETIGCKAFEGCASLTELVIFGLGVLTGIFSIIKLAYLK